MAQSRHHIFQQFAANEWQGFRKGVEKEGLRADASGFIEKPRTRTLWVQR